MRKFLILIIFIFALLIPVGVYAQGSNTILKATGRTQGVKFAFSADLTNNYGTGDIRIRELSTRSVYSAQDAVVNGIDVNGDQVPDVFLYTFYDPDLPHFYKLQATVVVSGVSDVYPKGIVHYTVYEGGIYKYSALEGITAGSVRVRSK